MLRRQRNVEVLAGDVIAVRDNATTSLETRFLELTTEETPS
ncbi:hypothetical protein [Kribbella sp. VKM Ac-2568]